MTEVIPGSCSVDKRKLKELKKISIFNGILFKSVFREPQWGSVLELFGMQKSNSVMREYYINSLLSLHSHTQA